MQKRHFEIIAETIRFDCRPESRAQTADIFARVFAQKFPRFDKVRFLRACGVAK
jgi:hypothetical protein